MPLYDFQCSDCGHIREDEYRKSALVKSHERMECPTCEKVRRFEMLFPAPATHDWGQGRYFEHVSATGETFYDKASFKRYMKKNGLKEHMAYE